MGVSYKIRSLFLSIPAIKRARIFWITLSMLYIVGCCFAPLWYHIETPTRFFGNDEIGGDVGWFIRDSCYNTALVFLPLLGFIKERLLQISLAQIFIAEGIREFYDLRWWNNQFYLTPFIINNVFIAGAILYLWFKLKKKHGNG